MTLTVNRAQLRSYEDLRDFLAGIKELPESNFLSYGLPLTHLQLLELEPLLKEHPTLKGLRLRGCNIRDDGAEVLSRAIAFNCTLEHLELPGNEITNGGAMFLANALRTFNHKLCTLDLQDNPCLSDLNVMNEIAELLARNNSERTQQVVPYGGRARHSPYKIQELRASRESEDLAEPNGAQLDQRVLCLEHDMECQREAMEQLKELAADLIGWKSQLDMASSQMASVLDMLGGEIRELKEQVAVQDRQRLQQEAQMPAAASAPPGAEMASLAAQFRSKHEELERSLGRLQETIGPRGQGVNATQRLLVDAVEFLTKRVEAMERQDALAPEMQSALEDIRVQTAALGAQLAEVKGQLQETAALGPQVERALGDLEGLRGLVTGLGQDIGSTTEAAASTSTNVATLAATCKELQEQLGQAIGSTRDLEVVVVRLAGDAVDAAAATAGTSATVHALEQSKGKLQQEVGKLQLAVGTLEQAMDSLDASERLCQQDSRLQQLESAQRELSDSLAEQLGAQDERLLGLHQRLAGTEEGVQVAQAALDALRGEVEQQPKLWREEARGLVAPLQQQLAEQGELVAGVAARVSDSEAAVGALHIAVAEHPAMWAAVAEAAVGPLQGRLAAVEAQQAADAESLQAAHQATSSLEARLLSAEGGVASLETAVQQQPAQWGSAVDRAVAPIAAHLADTQLRVAALEKGLAAAQACSSDANAAVAAVRETVDRDLPSQWRADIEGAVLPLREELATAQRQRVDAEEGLQGLPNSLLVLGTQLGRAEEAIATMAKHPGLWRGDIAAAVLPLRLQLDAADQAIDALRARLAGKAGAAREGEEQQGAGGEERVAGMEEQLKGLAAEVAALGAALAGAQASMAESAEARPWAEQLGALEGKHAETAAALSNVEATAAAAVTELRAAVEARPWLADVEAAAGRLQQSLDRVASLGDGAWATISALQEDAKQQGSATQALEMGLVGVQSQLASTQAAISELQQALDAQRDASAQAANEARQALAAAAARASEAEAAIESLRQEQELQPGRWEAAVAEAAGRLEGQLAGLWDGQKNAIDSVDELAEDVDEARTTLTKLQEYVLEHPSRWAAAVEEAVEPLRSELEMLDLQQTELKAQGDATSQAVAGLQKALSSAQAALREVQENVEQVKQHPDKWEAAIARMADDLFHELEKLGRRLDTTAETAEEVEELTGDLAVANSALDSLQEEIRQHPAKWEAAAAAAVGPVGEQLAALSARQEGASQVVGGLKQDLATLTAQAGEAQAALAALQEEVREHPAKWEAAAAAAVHPVGEQLAALSARQEGVSQNLGGLEQGLATLASQAGDAQAALAALQEEVRQHPTKWEAAAEAAGSLLRVQLAGLSDRQDACARIIDRVQDSVAVAEARLGAAVGAVEQEVKAHPALWQAAVVGAEERLGGQLTALQELQAGTARDVGELREAVAGAAARTGTVEAAVAALQDEAQQQPARWEATVQQTAAPIQQQLAALSEQQAGTTQAVSSMEELVASVVTKSTEMGAAISILQGEVRQEPSRWQAALVEAVEPLSAQITALSEQHSIITESAGRTERGLEHLAARAAETDAAISVLRGEVQAQPSLWESAVASVREQFAGLQEGQNATAAAVGPLEIGLSELAAKASTTEAAIGALQGEAEQYPARWEAAAAAAAAPIQQRVEALSEEGAVTAQAVASMEQSFAGLAARTGQVEAAIETLQEECQQFPAIWDTALAGVVEPINTKLAALGELHSSTLASLEHRLAETAAKAVSAEAAISALQEDAKDYPGRWEAAAAEAVEPISEQLAALAKQQDAAEQFLGSMEQTVAGVMARMEGAEAGLGALQEEVRQQPSLWATALAGATAPLQQQIQTFGEQQACSAQAICSMEERLAAVAEEGKGAVNALQEEVRQQPSLWEAAVEEAATPLQQQVEALQQQQTEAACCLEAANSAVAGVQAAQQQAAGRLDAVEAQLGEVAGAGALLHTLQQQVDSLAASLAAVPAPYDDGALACRMAGMEAAVAQLQASLAEVQAAVGSFPTNSTASGILSSPEESAEQELHGSPSLGAQLAALRQEVAALRGVVAAMEAAAADAAEEGAAGGAALLELAAAVGQLGQSQQDLASRVGALPALLLGEQEGASSPAPTPGGAPPLRLLLHSMSPGASYRSQDLESHPLLTARTWYEDSLSDLGEVEDAEEEALEPAPASTSELRELRASLVAQAKETMRLEGQVAAQAHRIDRLEGQLKEMRMLVGALAAGGAGQTMVRGDTSPPSATVSFMRKSLHCRLASASPLSTATHHTAYWDASSEAGEAVEDGLPSAPLLSTMRQQQRPVGRLLPSACAEPPSAGSPGQQPCASGPSEKAAGTPFGAEVRKAGARGASCDGSHEVPPTPGDDPEARQSLGPLCCHPLSWEASSNSGGSPQEATTPAVAPGSEQPALDSPPSSCCSRDAEEALSLADVTNRRASPAGAAKCSVELGKGRRRPSPGSRAMKPAAH